MAQYRGRATLYGAISDEQLGQLLDALVRHNGAVFRSDGNRCGLVVSYDAQVPTGFAAGLVPAIPQLVGTVREVMLKARLNSAVEVIGLSIERVID